MMKYNYILTFWSGNVLYEKDNINLFLSSIRCLHASNIKVLLVLTGCNNVDEVRNEFKNYSEFLQCYYIDEHITEYKIYSYSTVHIYLERYTAFYKILNELNILTDENTDMICMIDINDSYWFKNVFTCNNWTHKINLFSDAACFDYALVNKTIHPLMEQWIYDADKCLKKNTHKFTSLDYIINAGSILCTSLESWKCFLRDMIDIMMQFYNHMGKEYITDQAILNIYYYSKLFKECNETDFFLYKYPNEYIIGGYCMNNFKLSYINSKLIIKLTALNVNCSPAIYHCHFYNYPINILNTLKEKY